MSHKFSKGAKKHCGTAGVNGNEEKCWLEPHGGTSAVQCMEGSPLLGVRSESEAASRMCTGTRRKRLNA